MFSARAVLMKVVTTVLGVPNLFSTALAALTFSKDGFSCSFFEMITIDSKELSE